MSAERAGRHWSDTTHDHLWKVMEIRRGGWGLQESKCHPGLQKEKGGPKEQLSTQHDLCPWKGNGVSHSWGHLFAWMTGRWSAIVSMDSLFDQPTFSLWWNNSQAGWRESSGLRTLTSARLSTLSHNLLTGSGTGLDEWTVSWTGTWLNRRSQRFAIGGTGSSWRPATGGVPQSSILG